GIDCSNALVIGAEAENRLEILGDRAEVFDAGILVGVAPLADRHASELVQDRTRVDFLEIGLAVPVRCVAPNSSVGEAGARPCGDRVAGVDRTYVDVAG